MWKSDPQDPVPIYEQIENQLRYAIARGHYAPGDKLPSVRGLARESRVNPNTVVRVFRDLEHEGVIRTEGGRGAFVTEEAPAVCRRATQVIIKRRIERAISEARRAGLTAKEIRATVRDALTTLPQDDGHPRAQGGSAAGR